MEKDKSKLTHLSPEETERIIDELMSEFKTNGGEYDTDSSKGISSPFKLFLQKIIYRLKRINPKR